MITLKTFLEVLLNRAEDRAHHCEHFLGEDDLSVGMLHEPSDIKEDGKSRNN